LSQHESSKPSNERQRNASGISEDRAALMIERAVTDALDEHEKKMIAHMDRQFEQLRVTFASAFPNGDPHGHRMAHESQIKQVDGWQKLKVEVTTKFLSGGLWVAAAWAAYALWQAFVASLKN
jgi:hypothetical protein